MNATKFGLSALNYLIFIALAYSATGSSESCDLVGENTKQRLATVNKKQYCVNEFRYETGNTIAWLEICADAISQTTKDYLCRDLGFIGSNSVGKSKISRVENVTVKLECRGNETSLAECLIKTINSCENILYDVQCYNCRTDSQCNGAGVCGVSGLCVCESPHFGDNCEFKNCSSPCLGNRTCNTETGTCQCQAPFYGDNCQLRGTECAAQCDNGGYCDFEEATCQCPTGYYGDSCQFKRCSQPCKNGGFCLPSGECHCSNGTSGRSCENVFLNIFDFKLLVGVPLAGIGILTCIIVYILVLFIVQCIKITTHKCKRKSKCKKNFQQKLMKEIQNRSNLPDRSDANTPAYENEATGSNVNIVATNEVYYSILQPAQPADCEEEYTPMQLSYYNKGSGVGLRNLEKGNRAAREELASYVFLT